MFCAAEIEHDAAIFLKLFAHMETLQQTHLHILSRNHSIKLACYTRFVRKLLEINNAALKRLAVDG